MDSLVVKIVVLIVQKRILVEPPFANLMMEHVPFVSMDGTVLNVMNLVTKTV